MENALSGGGPLVIILSVIMLVWGVIFLCLPFIIYGMSGRLKEINSTLKAINLRQIKKETPDYKEPPVY